MKGKIPLLTRTILIYQEYYNINIICLFFLNFKSKKKNLKKIIRTSFINFFFIGVRLYNKKFELNEI